MIRTVDLAIVGADAAAVGAAIDAARRGLRLLVVIRSKRTALARNMRQSLRAALVLPEPQVIVLTGAEVACVAGVGSIEAVVVRYVRTGRLLGFNASALLRFGGGE